MRLRTTTDRYPIAANAPGKAKQTIAAEPISMGSANTPVGQAIHVATQKKRSSPIIATSGRFDAKPAVPGTQTESASQIRSRRDSR